MIVSPRVVGRPGGGGVLIVAVGGWFVVTVSVASALVACPNALETMQRNWSPLSARATDAIVYVD